MDKYKITHIEDDYVPDITLCGVNKSALPKARETVAQSGLRVGDSFYKIRSKKNAMGDDYDIAKIYRAQGRVCVDLCFAPISDYYVKHFYDNIYFMDAVRLKWAVARAVRARGDWPSFSSATNLRLLLADNMWMARGHSY